MTLEKKPLISIITVSLNSDQTIQRTIDSVKNQTYKNIEYIVIDGKSTDNTINIIKQNEKHITKWFSETDNGIYDAFNKGLKVYSGDYVGFLNSDDYLNPNAISILVRYINNYPEKDFFFGSVKKHWGILHGFKPWKIFFTWNFYTSHSTGFFIKKDAAKKIGEYNLKYKFSADYDYFYRMIVKHKMKGVATKRKEIFGTFRQGGFSSKINFYDHMCESTKIRIDNGQNKIVVLFTFLYKYLCNLKRIK